MIFVHLYLSDFCLPECEVQGQVLGRHCEEEDAEDNGNLLVDVLFLPKIQSGRLQPSEGKKKEDLEKEKEELDKNVTLVRSVPTPQGGQSSSCRVAKKEPTPD